MPEAVVGKLLFQISATDEELQKIAGHTENTVKGLAQNMTTAGRIGRQAFLPARSALMMFGSEMMAAGKGSAVLRTAMLGLNTGLLSLRGGIYGLIAGLAALTGGLAISIFSGKRAREEMEKLSSSVERVRESYAKLIPAELAPIAPWSQEFEEAIRKRLETLAQSYSGVSDRMVKKDREFTEAQNRNDRTRMRRLEKEIKDLAGEEMRLADMIAAEESMLERSRHAEIMRDISERIAIREKALKELAVTAKPVHIRMEGIEEYWRQFQLAAAKPVDHQAEMVRKLTEIKQEIENLRSDEKRQMEIHKQTLDEIKTGRSPTWGK